MKFKIFLVTAVCTVAALAIVAGICLYHYIGMPKSVGKRNTNTGRRKFPLNITA